MNRVIFALSVILFLLSLSSITGLVQVAKAESAPIYINADGSISPSTAPMYTADNVTYTLTGNITANANGIVIERNNIILNGKGYTVRGNNSGNLNDKSVGLNLTDTSNVLIEYVNIENFYDGIYLTSSSDNTISRNNVTANGWDGIVIDSFSNNNVVSGNNVTANTNIGIFLRTSSSNNVVSGNKATANSEGIWLHYSSNNTLIENNVTANGDSGIWLYYSSNNTVSDNKVTANYAGIDLESSSNNIVSGNTITENNRGGIWLGGSSNNTLYHNNFINNTSQVAENEVNEGNNWDNGYPSGGNYWSDYQTKYPNAIENDSSGIWNMPYIIDTNNIDHYPLMTQNTIPEFSSFLILSLFLIATLLAVIIHKKKVMPYKRL